ncbi:MAG: hypothetical protein IT585_04035 [candidate division Zixibacteria bacterium]|nr:hypothetical protein [candidate division Zixibacteria bacterium]
MGSLASNPKTAALIALLLCLPTAIIVGLALLDIQPQLGPMLSNADGTPSSLIPIGALLLLPVALLITALPIQKSFRAGQGLLMHPVNLALAVALVLMINAIAVGIIADQFPCWMGVVNCD